MYAQVVHGVSCMAVIVQRALPAKTKVVLWMHTVYTLYMHPLINHLPCVCGMIFLYT